MKTHVAALLVMLSCLGCKTPEPKLEIDIKSALKDKPPEATQTNLPPITISTRYASICPYCDRVVISQSCLPSGGYSGHVITNSAGFMWTTNMQIWTISYNCPKCHMVFSDTRKQVNPEVQSIRLPAIE